MTELENIKPSSIDGIKRLATQLANVVLAKQYTNGSLHLSLPLKAVQAKVYDGHWLSLKLDTHPDQIEWDPEMAFEFRLDTQLIHAQNIWVNENFVNLEFKQSIDTFHTISYSGHAGLAEPSVYHSAQAGLLSFYDLPIESNASHDSVLLCQSLAGGQTILFANTSRKEPVSLRLYNTAGMLLQTDERMMAPGKNQLPEYHLPAGIYFLQVLRSGQQQVFKWIKP